MKNRNILILAIMAGFVISFLGSLQYYLGTMIRNDVIIFTSIILLAPSMLLSTFLYVYLGYPGGLFGLTLVFLLCSFIIWTLFLYLIINLYHTWKFREEKKYLFWIILMTLIFLLMYFWGTTFATAPW